MRLPQLCLLAVEEQGGLVGLFMERGGRWTEAAQLIHLPTGPPAFIPVPWKLCVQAKLVWRYCFLTV